MEEDPQRECDSMNRPSVDARGARYYPATIRVVFSILGIWFLVSFGCGIVFREWLDSHLPSLGGAPFGFWMSQQGSIVCFVGLLILYKFWMDRLDRKFGFAEKMTRDKKV